MLNDNFYINISKISKSSVNFSPFRKNRIFTHKKQDYFKNTGVNGFKIDSKPFWRAKKGLGLLYPSRKKHHKKVVLKIKGECCKGYRFYNSCNISNDFNKIGVCNDG